MLLKKIQQTKFLIQEVKELQTKIDQHEQYKEYLDHLRSESRKCYEFFEAQRSLSTFYPSNFSNPDLNSFLDKVEILIDSFESDPKKIRITNTFRELESHNKSLEQEWYTFAKKESEDAMNTLTNVVRVIGQNNEIDQIIKSLKALVSKWPISGQNVQHFQQQCNNAKLKLSDLNASPSVQNFLERVNHKQATLADLTPEVVEWLSDNDFGKNLAITFK